VAPGFDHDDGATAGTSSNVAVPSIYRAFVFVAPRAASTRPDNGRITRIVPQEYLCDGEVCPEVTTALYLSPEDLASPQSIAKLFLRAIGLDPDPTTPDPTESSGSVRPLVSSKETLRRMTMGTRGGWPWWC